MAFENLGFEECGSRIGRRKRRKIQSVKTQRRRRETEERVKLETSLFLCQSFERNSYVVLVQSMELRESAEAERLKQRTQELSVNFPAFTFVGLA